MKNKRCLAVVYESGEIYIDSTITNSAELSSLVEPGSKTKVIWVDVKEANKRGLSQSALFHVWAKQLSDFTGYDESDTKQILKIKFGFPVLLQDETKGKQLRWILKRLGWKQLSFEQKLNLCEQWIPVTSAMTTNELNQMMKAIQDWAMNQFNIELTNKRCD